MSEHLEVTLDRDILGRSALNADGEANDLRINYTYDNEHEKPVILELGVPYTNNYPLDLHLNSAFTSVLPTFPHGYNIDPSILFNNPYNNRIPTPTPTPTPTPHTRQATSPHLTTSTRNGINYPAHIPQPLYSWSSAPMLSSVTLPDFNNKLPAEAVPSPTYMSYPDTSEHVITKRINNFRKEKPLQSEKDYKRTACDRERTRMRDMNRAFDLLRSKLPISKPNGKKYSKIESLRIAINYINHLQKILEQDKIDQINIKYVNELNTRSYSTLYRLENHITTASEDARDKFENLDASRSTWSDGSIPNRSDSN